MAVNWLLYAEAVGVVAFAVSGLIQGRRCEYYVVGLYVVALVTAFGGGTLRDLFLDRTPLFWIEHESYTLGILGLSLLFTQFSHRQLFSMKWWLVADALGLGVFAVASTAYAYSTGVSLFTSSLLGTVSATFGGVLRDILCQQTPSLFRSSPLYATCAWAGCMFYLLLINLPAENQFLVLVEQQALIAASFFTAALRLAAVRWNWVTPSVRS